MAVVLRKTLLVSIDDLLAVVREFLNPGVSRSGLDRCLRRCAIERHWFEPNGKRVGNCAICWRHRPGPSTRRSRLTSLDICMSM